MGLFNSHLPRDAKNKASDGMDERQSGSFGKRVAAAQGKGTKQDAKDAKATQRGK